MSAAPQLHTPIVPGTRIGPYDVVSRLSGGGMASLMLARRTGAAGFRRHVAIKVAHPHLVESHHIVKMFVDEAKISARIEHPNVVHVEELGEFEGSYYIVMEYVHGVSLAQLLAAIARMGKRISPELAVWIVARVAEGLHAAHELRDDFGNFLAVVHRDVSPQNILLAAAGHVKLIDFGIAKALGREYQTVSGSLKGKLKYMAPEQARSSHVDRRTDVYALGIVLWEMLTMRRMFRFDSEVELLEAVRSPQIQAPQQYCRQLPDALNDALLCALAPSMDERFATAQEFGRAITAALPGSSAVDASRLAALLCRTVSEELARKEAMLARSSSGEFLRAEERPKPSLAAVSSYPRPRLVHGGSVATPARSPAEHPDPKAWEDEDITIESSQIDAESALLPEITLAEAMRFRASTGDPASRIAPTDSVQRAPEGAQHTGAFSEADVKLGRGVSANATTLPAPGAATVGWTGSPPVPESPVRTRAKGSALFRIAGAILLVVAVVFAWRSYKRLHSVDTLSDYGFVEALLQRSAARERAATASDRGHLPAEQTAAGRDDRSQGAALRVVELEGVRPVRGGDESTGRQAPPTASSVRAEAEAASAAPASDGASKRKTIRAKKPQPSRQRARRKTSHANRASPRQADKEALASPRSVVEGVPIFDDAGF